MTRDFLSEKVNFIVTKSTNNQLRVFDGFQKILAEEIPSDERDVGRKNTAVFYSVTSTQKGSLVFYFHWICRDNRYWTSKKNSLELIGLSSINKVSLV